VQGFLGVKRPWLLHHNASSDNVKHYHIRHQRTLQNSGLAKSGNFAAYCRETRMDLETRDGLLLSLEESGLGMDNPGRFRAEIQAAGGASLVWQ
jgi:hypothetical protein